MRGAVALELAVGKFVGRTWTRSLPIPPETCGRSEDANSNSKSSTFGFRYDRPTRIPAEASPSLCLTTRGSTSSPEVARGPQPATLDDYLSTYRLPQGWPGEPERRTSAGNPVASSSGFAATAARQQECSPSSWTRKAMTDDPPTNPRGQRDPAPLHQLSGR